MKKHNSPFLMMTSEVARLLKKAPGTVIYYCKTGQLRALRTESGVRIFFRSDVERFAAARRAAKSRGGTK